MNNWIPCNEALPEKYGVYLVTLNYATTDFCEFDTKTQKFGWNGKICDEVVAWMPLPEPYQK